MDEYIDILDSITGEKTGEKILKKVAHKDGTWHGSIHILIVNEEKNKTLLQKRCELKIYIPIHGILLLVVILVLAKMILFQLKEN